MSIGSFIKNDIANPIAATGLRVAGGAADLLGADSSAQGYYRQASNVTNPTKTMNSGITYVNGLPLVNEYAANGGLPKPQQAVAAATNNGNGTATNTDGGSGAYTSDPAADAQAAADQAALQEELYGIDSGISSAQDGLTRLDNQRSIGAGNVNSQFQAAVDQLLGKRNLSNQQFNQSVTQQLNDYTAARNSSAANARTYLEGARRTLGAQGAGSGSAARYALPFEAQTMATTGNQAAQATNNKNVISLTQGHDKDQQAIDNEQKNVTQQRDQGLRDLDSQIQTKRASLLDTIAQLTGQRSILNGGNVAAAKAAADPYLTQIPGILNNIDSLSATVPIAAQDISLSKPDLSGYNFAQPVAAATPVQDPTLTQNPVIASLFGNTDQNQQNPAVPVVAPYYDPNQQQYALA